MHVTYRIYKIIHVFILRYGIWQAHSRIRLLTDGASSVKQNIMLCNFRNAYCKILSFYYMLLYNMNALVAAYTNCP